MMMQLGFVSAILPDASLEEVLATAGRIGYQCVELMCWPVGKAERRYAGVTHIDVDHLDAAGRQSVDESLKRHGVSISALSYYPNLLSPDTDSNRSASEHLKKVITAAAELGIGRVNSFVGRHPAQTVDQNWQPMLDCWGPLVEFAASHEIKIGIENCPMFFTDDEWPGGKNLATNPAIWRRMFHDLPSDAWGLNYDPSHPQWMQMDAIAPIYEFADRIHHVHAKDVRVDAARLKELGILVNPSLYHSPKLPGLGDVDWPAFFAALTDIGYRGPVCVEVEDRAYEGSDADRQLALIQSHAFLRPYIPQTIGD